MKDEYTDILKKFCNLCGTIHRTYDDGYSYLDCMRALKMKEGAEELRRLALIRDGNGNTHKIRCYRE